jgi:hypothetical protein
LQENLERMLLSERCSSRSRDGRGGGFEVWTELEGAEGVITQLYSREKVGNAIVFLLCP